MVQNIDFAPLFLDYAGLSVPTDMDGRSFRSILQGASPADWRDAIYYRYWQHQVNRPAHYGIRTATEKLIRFYGEPLGMTGTDSEATLPAWEYYDLSADPHESFNGYGDEANAARIRSLQEKLVSLKSAAGDER